MTARPMPNHGTRARYVRGCRCEPCSAANSRYCKQYRTHVHRSGGHGKRVDAEPVTQRIRYWESRGYTYTQIAAAAGVSRHAINMHAKAEMPTINPDNARKILAARLTPADIPAYQPIDATGTVRRLQALSVLGHPLRAVAGATGYCPSPLSKILNGHMRQVRAGTARDIADLYSQWSRQPGTCVRTRLRAQREGWRGPLDWDDIDDPTETADTAEDGPAINARQRAKERADELLHLARAGVPLPQIAERVGLSRDYVRDHIRDHHPRLFLELTA